jgi:Protein of unknown function (DUF1320)
MHTDQPYTPNPGQLKESLDYIIDADWEPYVRQRALQMIAADTNLLRAVERTAMGMIASQLQPRYDVVLEFNDLRGLQRNPQLVWWVMSYALYLIYQRIPDVMVPERITQNYQDSRADITAISDGKRESTLGLAAHPDGQPRTKFRHGGFKPRSHD